MRIVAAVLAVLAGAVVYAQPGVPAARTLRGGVEQPGQPSFRSGVELVTIDVVATGRDGLVVSSFKCCATACYCTTTA